jgi:hypothetical protein
MQPNFTILIVFSAASLGFIYMLIGAFRFSKRGSYRKIHRFDNNGMRVHQWEDFIGNHHDNISSDFGDCSDSGGDSGCD